MGTNNINLKWNELNSSELYILSVDENMDELDEGLVLCQLINKRDDNLKILITSNIDAQKYGYIKPGIYNYNSELFGKAYALHNIDDLDRVERLCGHYEY